MKTKATMVGLAAISLLVAVCCSACGGAKKLEWPQGGLAQVVPKLPAEYGEVAFDSADSLIIRAEEFSFEDYQAYIEECKKAGFTIDIIEEPGRSFSAFNDDGYSVEVSLQSDEKSLELTVNDSLEKKFETLVWPTSEIGELVPVPKSKVGFVYWENSSGFVIYVGETSKDEYRDYVRLCEEAGFTLDYNKGDDYFWADDANGNQVTVKFERNETMFIRADVAKSLSADSTPEATESLSREGNDKKANNQNQASTVRIGETVSDKNDVDFCVTSIEDCKSVGEGFWAVTTENNFIIVQIKITNNGNSAYDVNTLRFLLKEGDNEYTYCADAIMAIENHMYMDSINPGLSKEYTIVYETPYEVSERDWQLKILENAYSTKNSVYIILNETA